jgi:hypothetical protein
MKLTVKTDAGKAEEVEVDPFTMGEMRKHRKVIDQLLQRDAATPASERIEQAADLIGDVIAGRHPGRFSAREVSDSLIYGRVFPILTGMVTGNFEGNGASPSPMTTPGASASSN